MGNLVFWHVILVYITNLVSSTVIDMSYMLHLLANLWQLGAQLLQGHKVILQRPFDVRNRGVESRRRASLRLLNG